MADWHLAELRAALEKRGWRIVERDGDDYRISGTWELGRSRDPRTLLIDFDGLDDMKTLPIDQSYACRLRDSGVAIYFRRARNEEQWREELAAFIEAIEKR